MVKQLNDSELMRIVTHTQKSKKIKLFLVQTYYPEKVTDLIQNNIEKIPNSKWIATTSLDFSKRTRQTFLSKIFTSFKLLTESTASPKKMDDCFISFLKKAIKSQRPEEFLKARRFNSSKSGFLQEMENRYDKLKYIRKKVGNFSSSPSIISTYDILYTINNLFEKEYTFKPNIYVICSLESDKYKNSFPSIINDIKKLLLDENLFIFLVIPDVSKATLDYFLKVFNSIQQKELIKLIREKEITCDKDIIAWVDNNYRKLNLSLSSITELDLIEFSEIMQKNEKSKIKGLKILYDCIFTEYQEKKFSKVNRDIKKIWDNIVKKHPNYYYHSSRKKAPKIIIGKKDSTGARINKRFNIKIDQYDNYYINDIFIERNKLISTLERDIKKYLDGKILMEDKVNKNLIQIIEDILKELPFVNNDIERMKKKILSASLLEGNMVLQKDDNKKEAYSVTKSEKWFKDNWKIILAEPNVRSIKDISIYHKKESLLKEPMVKNKGFQWIHYKISKDLKELQRKYIHDLQEYIKILEPDKIHITKKELSLDDSINIQILFEGDGGEIIELVLKIDIPYYDVKLNGKKIKLPLPGNVIKEIACIIRNLLISSPTIYQSAREKILLKCIEMYCVVKEKKRSDAIYLYDLSDFVGKLPYISNIFRYENKTLVLEGIKATLSNVDLFKRLIQLGLEPLMKGSDPHTPFSVQGKYYIGFLIKENFKGKHNGR